MTDVQGLADHVRIRRQLPPPSLRRAIREAAGVTQAQLAEAVGVSRLAVTHWEKGDRSPRPDHLQAYVQALRLLRSGGDTDAA